MTKIGVLSPSLVGHIFYVPNLSEWHFFQYNQRDIEHERGNHWKEGAHIHFLNWLWPHYDAESPWAQFISGKAKLNDSLHARYSDTDIPTAKVNVAAAISRTRCPTIA